MSELMSQSDLPPDRCHSSELIISKGLDDNTYSGNGNGNDKNGVSYPGLDLNVGDGSCRQDFVLTTTNNAQDRQISKVGTNGYDSSLCSTPESASAGSGSLSPPLERPQQVPRSVLPPLSPIPVESKLINGLLNDESNGQRLHNVPQGSSENHQPYTGSFAGGAFSSNGNGNGSEAVMSGVNVDAYADDRFLKRRKRCGECVPCKVTKNCEQCKNCLNRKVLKQTCMYRKCVHLRKRESGADGDLADYPISPGTSATGGGDSESAVSPPFSSRASNPQQQQQRNSPSPPENPMQQQQSPGGSSLGPMLPGIMLPNNNGSNNHNNGSLLVPQSQGGMSSNKEAAVVQSAPLYPNGSYGSRPMDFMQQPRPSMPFGTNPPSYGPPQTLPAPQLQQGNVQQPLMAPNHTAIQPPYQPGPVADGQNVSQFMKPFQQQQRNQGIASLLSAPTPPVPTYAMPNQQRQSGNNMEVAPPQVPPTSPMPPLKQQRRSLPQQQHAASTLDQVLMATPPSTMTSETRMADSQIKLGNGGHQTLTPVQPIPPSDATSNNQAAANGPSVSSTECGSENPFCHLKMCGGSGVDQNFLSLLMLDSPQIDSSINAQNYLTAPSNGTAGFADLYMRNNNAVTPSSLPQHQYQQQLLRLQSTLPFSANSSSASIKDGHAGGRAPLNSTSGALQNNSNAAMPVLR